MSHLYTRLSIVILIGTFITGFCHPLIGQNKPEKPEFEKKVFRDDDDRLYIQKSLPVYLELSTSEDGSGETFRLKSKQDSEYTNPMHFDTEGINFIRHRWAVDPETKTTKRPKETIKFEIYADSKGPRTRISFMDAPSFVSPARKVYYGKNLKVKLKASDAVSGVAETHYALDASSYSNYNNPMDVNDEGDHNLYYFAHDRVGNAEKTRERTFTVDLTAPKTTKSIQGTYHNGNILSPKAKYVLESKDELAGVKYTYYQINDGEFKVYDPSQPVSVNYLSDGNHSITYYAEDRVENEESKESFDFYLDKIPPEVSVTLQGDKHEGKYTFVSPRTKVKMDATDNKAGVKHIKYRIDNEGNQTYQNPFQLKDEKGTQKVVFFARDKVENRSAAGNKTVYMDNQPPNSSIAYGDPKFFTRDTLFINESTNVRLRANDYESGVKETAYQVNGGSQETYQDPFNVSQEGYHTIKFWTTDRVNNEEDKKESHVFVDNTPPNIYHNFSIDPIGTKQKDGKTLKVYPNYTRLYLGATDEKSGNDKILYSMDGGKTYKAYSSPETLDISELDRFEEEKYYSVKVKAIDKLGNESQETFDFYVGIE